MLDDETVERIDFALRQILRQRIADGDKATTNALNSNRSRGTNDPELYVLWAIVRSAELNRRMPFAMRNQPDREPPARLRSNELELIRIILPDHALDFLDLVAAGDPATEALTLQTWSEETVRRKIPKRPRDDSTLIERYNRLSPSQQATIDLLPPKDFIDQLTPNERFSR